MPEGGAGKTDMQRREGPEAAQLDDITRTDPEQPWAEHANVGTVFILKVPKSEDERAEHLKEPGVGEWAMEMVQKLEVQSQASPRVEEIGEAASG